MGGFGSGQPFLTHARRPTPRQARFHNIYGPYGTWKGGREKAPASFCRKVLTSPTEIEMCARQHIPPHPPTVVPLSSLL